jgi:hypothetical protein
MGPHASLGEQAHVFDRFVGAWDCHYVHLAEDGRAIEDYDGRVTFGWIIDGWAVQDVWSGGGSVGTSIRWFDPSTGEWTVIWLAPQANVITSVRGGAVGATGSAPTRGLEVHSGTGLALRRAVADLLAGPDTDVLWTLPRFITRRVAMSTSPIR